MCSYDLRCLSVLRVALMTLMTRSERRMFVIMMDSVMMAAVVAMRMMVMMAMTVLIVANLIIATRFFYIIALRVSRPLMISKGNTHFRLPDVRRLLWYDIQTKHAFLLARRKAASPAQP